MNTPTEQELLPAPNQPTYSAPPPGTAVLTSEVMHLPVAPRPQPTVIELMGAVLEQKVTGESVAVVKELALLRRQEFVWQEEKDFNAAFVALQADLPVIVASSVIPKRGKYEKFEDIMTVVAPLLKKHGFSVSFSNDFRDGRIIETCHLARGCHSRPNSYAVRTKNADNETQSDTMAATTAKRNALCQALNIVIRQDCLDEEHDARLEGGNVTAAQADELRHRVKMLGSNVDEVAFLKFAGAATYAEIPAAKYDVLDQNLRRKETGK